MIERKTYQTGQRVVGTYPISILARQFKVDVTVFSTPKTGEDMGNFEMTVTGVSKNEDDLDNFFQQVDAFIEGATK